MLKLHYLLADLGLGLISLSAASGLLLVLARKSRALSRWYWALRLVHLLSGGGAVLLYLLTYFLAPKF